MIASTINRHIELASGAFASLGVKVPIEEVERISMVVHHSMDHGRRRYHTSSHVFDVCEGMNPRQVLAGLFHDVVYYQLDGGFPKTAAALLLKEVYENAASVKVRPGNFNDVGYFIFTGIFGFGTDDVLPLYAGMNEFLSAIVATRSLEPYLPVRDLVAIVACIEATIPFRLPNAQGESSLDTLSARIRKLNDALALNLSSVECAEIVRDAAIFGNRDVASFCEENHSRFLSTTWLLIEESNAPLADAGVYSLTEYREALSRMEKFLSHLNPNSIFHNHPGVLSEVDLAERREAARRNLEFSSRYLGMKLVSIAMVEALAKESGGDCPVSMLLGDMHSPLGKPLRIEDLISGGVSRSASVDPHLLAVLEGGRTSGTSVDLSASPLTAIVYLTLGEDGMSSALNLAQKMFVGEMSSSGFLRGLDKGMVRRLAEGCAMMAPSRRERLSELAREF